MPTYDYECTKCGDEFCIEQGMNDKPLKKCKKCGGKLQKLPPKSLNLIFKGSGFYVTDYRKGKDKGRGEVGEAGPAKPAGKTAGPENGKS